MSPRARPRPRRLARAPRLAARVVSGPVVPGLVVPLLVVPLLVVPAGSARAQGVGDIALHWTRGDYRSPLVCEVEGAPHRVVRRITIEPERRVRHRTTNRITFHDLEAPGETSCYDDQGRPESNVIGTVRFVHEGRRDRPDLAQRDFVETLKREGGFDFAVQGGALSIGPPGAPVEELRRVDFREGTLRIDVVTRGSEAWRRLSDFGPRRKLVISLSTEDGETLDFDLVEITP